MRHATTRSAVATFACAFALAWLLSRTVVAQVDAAFALTWQADATCPDRTWAEARLRDRLGPELSRRAATTFTASANLTRTPEGFRLTLSTKHGTQRGERKLAGARCEELAEAAVLVIALSVEAHEGVAAETPAASGTTTKAPATAPRTANAEEKRDAPVAPARPEAPQAEAQAPAPAPRAEVREAATAIEAPTPRHTPASPPFALGAAALLDVGFLPQPALGVQGGLAYIREPFRAELAGFWLPTRSSEANRGGSVAVSLWALRPTGCTALWRRTLKVDVCLGLELGRAAGSGRDLNRRRERSWIYRAAWAGLRLASLSWHGLSLVLEPAVAVPLGRPSFVSVDPGDASRSTLHTPQPVSGRVTLGLELRF